MTHAEKLNAEKRGPKREPTGHFTNLSKLVSYWGGSKLNDDDDMSVERVRQFAIACLAHMVKGEDADVDASMALVAVAAMMARMGMTADDVWEHVTVITDIVGDDTGNPFVWDGNPADTPTS